VAKDGAKNGALNIADADLAKLIRNWPSLPKAVRRCIIALLNDATREQKQTSVDWAENRSRYSHKVVICSIRAGGTWRGWAGRSV